MRGILLSLLVLLQFSVIFGQDISKCATDKYTEDKLMNSSNEERTLYEQNINALREKAFQRKDRGERAATQYVIPVVVHVFHDNGVGDISEEQVLDGIRVLNEDFRRLHADTIETRDVFKEHAGVADFEFRLAKKDPSGNATNGIIRVNTPQTNGADDNIKSLSSWPTSRYFNIWLVNAIDLGLGGLTLGYAELPMFGIGNSYGIVVRNDRWGRFGTATSGDRTGTHEVGHSFGLYHTFQEGCGSSCAFSGDEICDTPPVSDPAFDCDDTQNTCSNDMNGSSPFSTNVPDQIENFMSYNACQNMFTKDQVNRMQTSLETFTSLENLTSSTNLTLTGVDQLYTADFNSDVKYVCTEGKVAFKDWSTYGQIGWEWFFDGAYPPTSSLENPVVTYTQPGLYDVSLTVSSPTSSKNESKSAYIFVSNPLQNYPPLSEDFESITSVPSERWFVYNPSNDIFTFELTQTTGYSGNSSIKMNNYFNSKGEIDELVSSAIDLSPLDNVSISFRTAYAQHPNSTSDDKLRVFISNDCGESWSIRYATSGVSMGNAPAQISSYTPSDTSEWVKHTFSGISANYKVENFMFKFVFESDSGNNLYIDDINMSSTFSPVPVLYRPIDEAENRADNEKIDWKSIPSVDQYEYQIDTDPSFSTVSLISGIKQKSSDLPNDSDTEFETNNLIHGQIYFWRVRSITAGTPSDWSDIWQFTVSSDGVGIWDTKKKEQLRVQVTPNPLNDRGSVNFNLNTTSPKVTIAIFDLLGKQVKVDQQSNVGVGNQSFPLDTKGLEKGVYLIKVTAGSKVETARFILQ